jgi:cyanate lyase
MLRDAGMSFEKIAEEVGHQSVATTMNNYSYDVNTDEENRRILNQGLNFINKVC